MRLGRAFSLAVALAWPCCVSCTPFNDHAPHDAGADANGTEEHGLSVKADRCANDEDCVATSQCSQARCEQGRCVVSRLRAGTSPGLDLQSKGDCRTLVCDDQGRVHSDDDDTDKPDGDGNPCHAVKCEGGALRTTNMEDGSRCNDTGVCTAGECSKCIEGAVCPRTNDCTVFKWTCKSGVGQCEDTGEPRVGGACEEGKVCSGGSCVGCVVGAECDLEIPCHTGRRKTCSDEICTPVPVDDGTPCGDGSTCRAGACVPAGVLSNGDFQAGLDGWTLDGDAALFTLAAEPNNYDRRAVSTSTEAAGAAAQGTLSQTFVVPSDALALRFNVSGGHARVQLKDETGALLEECGAANSAVWLPVSWDLSARRGKRLTLAIEDSEADDEWAFIRTSGFDVIREVETPLRNSQFARGLEGWDSEGEGEYFNVYDDYSWQQDEKYGRRMSVSTYARDSSAAGQGSATRGVISQTFMVPLDAVAIRFNVCGGSEPDVRLYEGSTQLFSVSAANSDVVKIGVSWDLEPHRGKQLRLAIEDDEISLFGYIGATGFDVITSFNGP